MVSRNVWRQDQPVFGSYPSPGSPPIPSRGPLEKFEEWIGRERVVLGIQFIIRDCLTYPSTVFCRQCQVYPYNSVGPLYTAPWRSLAVMNNITQSQGIRSWWRGWQAHALLQLGQPVVDAVLERILLHNRKQRGVVSSLITGLLFNSLTCSVCMPLLSFSIMEAVQNTVLSTYSSDYEGFKEFVLERPLLYPDVNKRLSYAQLLLPTLLLTLGHSATVQLSEGAVQRLLPSRHTNSLHHVLYRVTAVTAVSFMADALLYPLGTVVARLHCQGLPVLVENIESGLEVQYITSYYSGFLYCVRSVWESEGVHGFFKGFSSVLLQYAVQGAVLLLLWRALSYYENWSKRPHPLHS